jgi:macrolide-specific efflux system membrane fusion protein
VVSLDGRVGQTVSGSGTQVTSTGSGSPSAGAASSGAGAGAGGTSGAGGSGSGGAGAAQGGSSGAGGASAGGASGSAGTSFLSLADLDTLQVQAQLPELDVGQVRDGQSVAVSINALPGRPLRGVVSGINALPDTGASVQYGTTIGLEGRPAGLRLGQSASVAITTARAEGALFLPNAAIEPQGGATATEGSVLVYAGGRQERRTVGLGIAADTVTQITRGLAVGELVVLPEPAASPLFQGGRGGNGGGPGNSGSDGGTGGPGSGGGTGGTGSGGGG